MAPSDDNSQREPSSISRARRYSPRGKTLRESNPNQRKRTSAQREEPPAPADGDPRAERRRRAAERSRRRREAEAAEAPPSAPADTGRRSGKTASGTRKRPPRQESDGASRPAGERRRASGSTAAPKKRAPKQGSPKKRAPKQGPPGTKRKTQSPTASRSPRAPKTAPRPRRERTQVRSLHGHPQMGDPRRRMKIMATFVILLLVVSGARLIQLQLFDAARYAEAAHAQRLTVEPVPAARGTVLDRNGNRLVYTVDANYIGVDPQMVEGDPGELAAQLAPLVGRPASELEPLIATDTSPDGKEVRFAYLQRGVDTAIGKKIEAMENPGLVVGHDARRVAHGRDLAANILGFTNIDGQGMAGMEASYDDWLAGKDGEISYERSADGKRIPGAFYREDPAEPGRDLDLTIDWDLQYQTQQILEDAMDDSSGKWGSAIVMDSATGEVLAMASSPTYDAADPGDLKDAQMRDYATGQVNDPGSIHKAITFAAALNEGVIGPDESWYVDQTINKGGTVYQDTYPHGGAELRVEGMLAQSSNVGTIEAADRLGAEALYEYQQEFGLGKPTGVGMPGEAPGMLLPPDEWSGTSYGSIPIGHENTASLIQMAAAYNVIANDGVYKQPNLVTGEAAGEKSGHDGDRVLKAETAEEMQHLLQAPIYADTGTGKNAALDGYAIAGKTGTGKLVQDGEYQPGSVASFAGFGPADGDARYVVAVSIYDPSNQGGGAVTGKAFGELNEMALQYYGVKPDPEASPEFREFA
ncbi:peptidoglycan D,D-transpeptidase FtsI family protein [Salininema proteolyticum]|uniref:Penicillin-binding transpeptidase domain-containing protein n=1 Tax=Salininema proteolyticum TaxID=1607685 RepID=A0ABV8U0I4_9ACTN